jgi:hypothetical protein
MTEQQATLQRADADHRKLQAMLRNNEAQSKNVVRAFAWSENEGDAITYDFSLPPGSRNFEVTESILRDLALISENNDTPGFTRLQKYDIVKEIWVGFKIGQVFDAEAHRRRFFFKRQEVKHCLGFDSHIGQAASASGLHMRDNLTGERSYVRDTLSKQRAAKLELISPSPALSISNKPYTIPISSDDEADSVTCNPRIPNLNPIIPLSITRKRSLRQFPEIDIVLDSDEEDEAVEKRLRMGKKKQKMDKQVKLQDSDEVEIIIVLDSDEEDEAVEKRRRMGKKKQKIDKQVKLEDSDEVEIKMERCASHMDILPRRRKHVNQPFIDTVFHGEDNSPKWPQDYYVCDVAKAFREPPRGVSKKAAFRAYFPGVLFKKSTYYDNYNLWIRTPINICTKHSNYGRTPRGSWREFLVARAQNFDK